MMMSERDHDRRAEENRQSVENTVGQIKVPVGATWATPGDWTDYSRSTEAEVLLWVARQRRPAERRAVDWITHEPIN